MLVALTHALVACAPHAAPPAGVGAVASAQVEVDESALGAVLAGPERPLLVSFWATWCAPCLDELATLELVASRRPDVDVLLVSLDAPSVDPAAVLRARGCPLRNVHLRSDDPAAAMRRLLPAWDDAIPLTLLVLPDGEIAASFHGATRPDTFLYALPRLIPTSGNTEILPRW